MANSVLPAVGLRAKVVQAAHAAMIASAGADYTPNGKTVNGFDGSGFVSYVLQQVFPAYKHLDTAHIASSDQFYKVKAYRPEGNAVFVLRRKVR
jgi:hypothetical protein